MRRFRKSSSISASRKQQHTALAFETLESRQMLSANSAVITGLVTNDLQGDGNSANDSVVVGASAKLYLDNGNGAFDAADAVVGAATTDVTGRYTFEGLGAGRYFVKVTPPSAMQFRAGDELKTVTISADEGDGVVGPTIDGFTTTQMVEASPPPVSNDHSSQDDAAVLGGERDMYVVLNSSTNPFSSVLLASSGGNLYVASGPGATGDAKIVWDGNDNSATAIDFTGLGGVDLTQSGGNQMTGIALTSGADHPNSTITLRIYTDAANWSEFTTVVPESLGGAATGQAVFNFSDAPTAKSGAGANFKSVGALELTFEGVTAVDAQVSLVGLVGRAVKQLDFTAAPRLSLGDKVWADVDDDGRFESGESGIAGVVLNLYQDTNGDNQYSAGVDALLGSQTTDSEGNYLFTDLLPGKYIVQVAPTNFQSTGKLAGLNSSSPAAADPDDNANNDDNGTPLAGAGVVSQAITLTGGAEPTNDGDSDPNTNSTVDFGFFGFDLALDKAVQQFEVSPNETINYTVKIDNSGPSAAAGTVLTDTLPAGVVFVSGETSIPGVGVTHAGGIVTANLGTLQPGATVFVTIVAQVSVDASGTLVNIAKVAAPKEVNLSNNTDTVTNLLVPKIDLAIDKTDSSDPVEPGSTFSYTLVVTNHGPSNATGVVVTDTLPGSGVTYVGASKTPASTAGGQLVFNVGNLARGASTSIVIDVRVDDNFEGQLLNHAEVYGNEQEITLLNNEDLEPTIVKTKPATIGGSVFVDRDDDGVFDANETPIPNVVITLRGADNQGNAVIRTTTTNSAGEYLFEDLGAGNYRLEQQQPARYKDGKEHLGTLGGATGTNPGPLLVPSDVSSSQLQDLIFNIDVQGGDVGLQYDFGELASATISKRSFLAY